jgi:hypothetical protein
MLFLTKIANPKVAPQPAWAKKPQMTINAISSGNGQLPLISRRSKYETPVPPVIAISVHLRLPKRSEMKPPPGRETESVDKS